MTNALACTAEPLIQQVRGETPEVMTRILDEDVNLAIWQRQLPVHIADFGALLLSLDEPLADAIVIDMSDETTPPNLRGLACRFNDPRRLHRLYCRCFLAGERLCVSIGRQTHWAASQGLGQGHVPTLSCGSRSCTTYYDLCGNGQSVAGGRRDGASSARQPHAEPTRGP